MPAIAKRVMATLGEPRLRTSQPANHISDTDRRGLSGFFIKREANPQVMIAHPLAALSLRLPWSSVPVGSAKRADTTGKLF